jgi:Cu/Ag efflux protein CusF
MNSILIHINPTHTKESSMIILNNEFRVLRRAAFAWMLLVGTAPALLAAGEARAQAMSPNMDMPGMSGSQQAKTATGVGTVTAVNAASRKVTFDHGPMPDINWPAMKMEFSTAPSVDLSKVRPGDKVRFTLSGSGNSYTVQSISPSQ